MGHIRLCCCTWRQHSAPKTRSDAAACQMPLVGRAWAAHDTASAGCHLTSQMASQDGLEIGQGGAKTSHSGRFRKLPCRTLVICVCAASDCIRKWLARRLGDCLEGSERGHQRLSAPLMHHLATSQEAVGAAMPPAWLSSTSHKTGPGAGGAPVLCCGRSSAPASPQGSSAVAAPPQGRPA